MTGPMIQKGATLTTSSWDQWKRVCVEWVGESMFGGTVYSGEGADAYQKIGQTFTHGQAHSKWTGWPKPEAVVKEWIVTTEERIGIQNQVEVVYDRTVNPPQTLPPFIRPLNDRYGIHAVITAVRPHGPRPR